MAARVGRPGRRSGCTAWVTPLERTLTHLGPQQLSGPRFSEARRLRRRGSNPTDRLSTVSEPTLQPGLRTGNQTPLRKLTWTPRSARSVSLWPGAGSSARVSPRWSARRSPTSSFPPRRRRRNSRPSAPRCRCSYAWRSYPAAAHARWRRRARWRRSRTAARSTRTRRTGPATPPRSPRKPPFEVQTLTTPATSTTRWAV